MAVEISVHMATAITDSGTVLLSSVSSSQQAYVVGMLHYALIDDTLKYYPSIHFINKVSKNQRKEWVNCPSLHNIKEWSWF